MLPPAGPGIRPPAPGRRKSVTRAAWPEVHDAVANALPGGYSPGLQDHPCSTEQAPAPWEIESPGTTQSGPPVPGPRCSVVPARGIRNDLVLHLADPGQEPARHSQKAAGCPAAEVSRSGARVRSASGPDCQARLVAERTRGQRQGTSKYIPGVEGAGFEASVQDPGKPVRQPAEGVVVLDAAGAQLVVGLRCCPSMSLNPSASGGASWNAITPRSRFQTRSTGTAYSSRSTTHGLPLLVPPSAVPALSPATRTMPCQPVDAHAIGVEADAAPPEGQRLPATHPSHGQRGPQGEVLRVALGPSHEQASCRVPTGASPAPSPPWP